MINAMYWVSRLLSILIEVNKFYKLIKLVLAHGIRFVYWFGYRKILKLYQALTKN